MFVEKNQGHPVIHHLHLSLSSLCVYVFIIYIYTYIVYMFVFIIYIYIRIYVYIVIYVYMSGCLKLFAHSRCVMFLRDQWEISGCGSRSDCLYQPNSFARYLVLKTHRWWIREESTTSKKCAFSFRIQMENLAIHSLGPLGDLSCFSMISLRLPTAVVSVKNFHWDITAPITRT